MNSDKNNKPNTSFKECVAQDFAMAIHLQSQAGYEDTLELLLSESKVQEQAGIVLYDPYTCHEGKALVGSIVDNKDSLERLLTRHQECIKRGLSILGSSGSMSLDINDWSIDIAATVGDNVTKTILIEGASFTFSHIDSTWSSDTVCDVYGVDINTGLPLVSKLQTVVVQ